MIKDISIFGFRGFGQEQKLEFSLPNGTKGSGLTFLVGPNNSGKTTIIESIRAFNGNRNEPPSFSVGKRNAFSRNIIKIHMTDNENKIHTIETVQSGGSNTKKTVDDDLVFYVLQSRRFVEYEFGEGKHDRNQYLHHYNKLNSRRTSQLDGFFLRLFSIMDNKSNFDSLLKRIVGDDITWTIDQSDNGQFFINYTFNGITHSSEGVGDGIWSIFTICDALYDSQPKSTIIIDEPELSLHPSIQKQLMNVLIEQAQDKQIIISTHSPYFINWEAIISGANLIRTVKNIDGNIHCYNISRESKNNFRGILNDLNNPHTLGLDANEVFFLSDKVILVEGQEDVIIFRKIISLLGKPLEGDFFGWGVGGAHKMSIFLHLFSDLGYKKIMAIYDGDKLEDMESMQKIYPNYEFRGLVTDDIRDKTARTTVAKNGITDSKGNLKDEHKEFVEDLIESINQFMQ